MKERPILFNGAMVRAILSGQKTQTRRVVKGMALEWLQPAMFTPEFVADPFNGMCPYGQPGDRLWVRECFADPCYRTTDKDSETVLYRADGKGIGEFGMDEIRWKPSIHMPRWACRIVLEIVSVRVERLNDISEADALAEGILADSFEYGVQRYFRNYRLTDEEASTQQALTCPIESFRSLWESINGHESWQANPWVWVVEFKRIA